MVELKHILYYALSGFNILIVSYFFVGNGVYTVLMFLSLVCVWLHNRRLDYQGLEELRASAVTPPVTILMPAWNEQESIVQSVRSVLEVDYPNVEVFVVDDGSTDATLARLLEAFHLVKMDLIYRPRLATRPVLGFYFNPLLPKLLVISKENGGKPDALNAGINMCRTPYFCSLDADCVMERDALLRLIRPILRSPLNTVVSGGIVRILNGCEVRDGRLAKVQLPKTRLELFQVVEYLRAFLFGRTGWNLLGGTLIVSGAFALFHRESVIDSGGFSHDTVTEDVHLIAQLHRWAAHNRRRIKMSFTSDPICWTECPSTVRMLARQRRRWQLGLCQTLWKYKEMLFNPRYGVIGVLSYPFHVSLEALGAVVELLGYLVVPLALLFGMVRPSFALLLIFLGLIYAGFLSVGAVLLEELTYRRYPRLRDLFVLIFFAMVENLGYRQLVLYFRVQGVLRFLTGFRTWEKVVHTGAGAPPGMPST